MVQTGFRQPNSPSKNPPLPDWSLLLSDWLRTAPASGLWPASAPPLPPHWQASCSWSFSTLLSKWAVHPSLGLGLLPPSAPCTVGSMDSTLRSTHCVGVRSVSGVQAGVSPSSLRYGGSEIGVLKPDREGEGARGSWIQVPLIRGFPNTAG